MLGAPPCFVGKSQVCLPYLQHCMRLGRDRMFQSERNFLFWALAWKFQQKSGTISLLADMVGMGPNNDPVLTVENAIEFLRLSKSGETASPLMSNAKMVYLMSRIKPFSKLLPGTSMYVFAAGTTASVVYDQF